MALPCGFYCFLGLAWECPILGSFRAKKDRKHKQNMEVGFNSTTTGSQRLDRVVMGEIVKIIDRACSEPKIHMKHMKIHIKKKNP